MFANIVLCCALAFWIGAGLLWLGRHTCRTFKGGLLRRSGPGTRIAMLVMALYSLYVGGSKRGSVTVSDDYIADAGSYLTNDVAHVAISKKTSILPDDTEILVYARELSSSNVADWVRLEPHLTFEDHPYDYTLVNATNYNVRVAASYTPAPTVHTNGVWVLRGFEIPGWNSHYSFGNTKIAKRRDPYRYQVEYLESTGTQWIEVPMVVDSSATLNITGYVGESNKELFSFGKQSRTQFNIETGGTYYRWWTSTRIDIGSGYVGALHSYKCNSSIWVDGVLKGTSTPTSTDSPQVLYILNGSHGATSGRIYHVSVEYGGVLILDCIPVVDKSGVPCLYDKVTETFFYNQGTGTFGTGSRVY